MVPAIDAAITFVGDLGLIAGLALELYLARLGDVDLQLLVEHDAFFGEAVAGPKLARSQRFGDGADEAILQRVAGTQGRNADVLLMVVGIDRGIRDGEVLDGRFLRGDHGAIGLENADVGNFQLVAEGAVADFELSQGLHTAFADYANSRIQLLAAGTIILKADGLMMLLDDVGFLRIVGRSGRVRRSRLRRLVHRLLGDRVQRDDGNRSGGLLLRGIFWDDGAGAGRLL